MFWGVGMQVQVLKVGVMVVVFEAFAPQREAQGLRSLPVVAAGIGGFMT